MIESIKSKNTSLSATLSILNTKHASTVIKMILGLLLFGNVIYHTFPRQEGNNEEKNGRSKNSINDVIIMEHNFYDEENPIVVDSIRRACGSFDRIRKVQKECDTSRLKSFHSMFHYDQSLQENDEFRCTQKEPFPSSWVNINGINFCSGGWQRYLFGLKAELGFKSDAKENYVLIEDPLLRLFDIWDITFNKQSNFTSIRTDFAKSIELVEISKYSESHTASFSSFLEFIASNPSEDGHHPFWQSQVQSCSPCSIEYRKIIYSQEIDDLKTTGIRVRRPEVNKIALEEFKKISKKTILDLYRHYFVDYIMFGLSSSTIDLLLDNNNLRLPQADLFKRKNSYWANSSNREKYQAIRYC